MALESARKIQLNRITYSVRASQAVLQYGVGAMVDFQSQTLMTAAPEYWKEQVVQIHDERLEKVLHVDYFGLPGGRDDPHCREGISYARFPEWYFCPKCRKFQSIKDWVSDYRKQAKQRTLDNDPEMVKYMRCPKCGQDLVVTRIVTACECGHIDDFPWVKWVHCQNMGGVKPICPRPSLTFKTSASSTEGLEGLTVSCETCKARATLKGAFDNNKLQDLDEKYDDRYNFRCTGRHPWKHTKENCGKYPKVLQRGSSSVYFPVTESSLVIPPYSSLVTKKVEQSSAFSKCKDAIADYKKNTAIPKTILPDVIRSTIGSYVQDISLEIGVGADKVTPILERKWMASEDKEEYTTMSVKYRAEEYEALSGEISVPTEEYGDFVREETDIKDYAIPYIRNVSLIHKVREVQALVGFTRLKPAEPAVNSEESKRIVSVKQSDSNWYPAYEVRGEGIFIEFDETAISEWQEKHPEIQRRVDTINENYRESYFGESRPREITAKFLLLHTISHALIKQLSFECGYSIASLKERLYCSEQAEGKQMAGILIYTASGDSEGTMGGLVRQGRSDIFPGIFRKAMEAAVACSNDPVCNLSRGQGRDMLNLAACYSCCLVPETSCEEFNVFLDRGTIVGTYENRDMGFYAGQLFNGGSWKSTDICTEQGRTDRQNKNKLYVTDMGISLADISYREIWNDLKSWSDEEKEITLLSDLAKADREFSCKEKPHKDCQFRMSGDTEQYACDLYWEKSGVALFTADNEDCYLAAKNSDIRCFYSLDAETTPESILNSLKEN